MPHIRDLLCHVVENNGSDLHVKAGAAPSIRAGGLLQATAFPSMSAPDCERAADELM